MIYNITQLQQGFNMLESFLKSYNIKEIPVEKDYYWNIESIEKFCLISQDGKSLLEPSRNDESLNIGSLFDDIKMLDKAINGSNAITVVDIDRLAHVLEYLTYYINCHILESKNK